MIVNFRRLWHYSLAVAMLMFLIGIAIDSTDVTTYTRQVRDCMAEGDYAGALRIGERSDKTDRQLMMLRMEALRHEHLMGERLFGYPIVGEGKPLVGKGGDYELCAYLIDRDLNRFAVTLPKYYTVSQLLPRHYREALVLYNHLRANPVVVYHDNVMDTDFKDLQKLRRTFADKKAAQVAVSRNSGGTYWYYYYYLNNFSANK